MLQVQPDQVDFIVADLDLYTQGEVVALGLNMDANLRSSPPLGTPVDTGWARANWLPSVGEPLILDADERAPTPSQVASRAEQSQQGLNNLLSWRLDHGPIFDTNNVPYIGVLNAGHSPQSPPGFVQNALEQAVKETYSAGASRASRARRASAAKGRKPRPKR